MKLPWASALVTLVTSRCCAAREIAGNANINFFLDDLRAVGHKNEHRELQLQSLLALMEQDPELSTQETELPVEQDPELSTLEPELLAEQDPELSTVETELPVEQDPELSTLEPELLAEQDPELSTVETELPVEQDHGLPSLLELVEQDPELSTLESAFAAVLSLTGLTYTLFEPRSTYTLFAPVDQAFYDLDKLDPALLTQLLTPEFNLHLKNLLTYHLAKGELFRTNLKDGMKITMLNDESITIKKQANGVIILEGGFSLQHPVVDGADIEASNGVMHKIAGGVLLPKFTSTDIYDVLKADPNYSKLVEAIDAAGLEASLRTGTVTVLAPDNDAFAALPHGFLKALFADTQALQDILLYHVVEGSLPSNLVETGLLPTLYDGLSLDVKVNRHRQITFNGVLVVDPDILARNGIIHGISSVLIPPIVPKPAVAPIPVPPVRVPTRRPKPTAPVRVPTPTPPVPVPTQPTPPVPVPTQPTPPVRVPTQPTPTSFPYPPGADKCFPWKNQYARGRRRTEFRAASVTFQRS